MIQLKTQLPIFRVSDKKYRARVLFSIVYELDTVANMGPRQR